MTVADVTSGTNPEVREFQTEARQLLDLMIHSVYSNKDIFLRELISNASDALDKLHFEALTNADFKDLVNDSQVRLEVDRNARTLAIMDNGIGMSRDEVVKFIGTIARSGTRDYAKLLQEARAGGKEVTQELIGQFGVGFYSSFMVADRVSLVTRRAGENHATCWESSGDGTYTLSDGHRDQPGTTVLLHLKPSDTEDGLHDYTNEYTLRDIVKRYSDFVSYPIRMTVERTEYDRDEDGKIKEGSEARKVLEDETLNSQKAIWTRPESEVTEEEYADFYRHVSHDWSDPLLRIHQKAEGVTEFRSLLFIPSRAPMDLFSRESEKGIHLYIRRVFIMSDAKEIVPEYLRFLRGVVDSEDLSLNVSREILQKDRKIAVIRKAVVRKTLDTLKALRRDDREKYETFWKEFGRVLKEGLFQDNANRDTIFESCEFHSTADPEKRTTLQEYIERAKPGQKEIYYLCGPSLEAVNASPHLEAFRDKGYEVLLLTDPVDEVWSQATTDYKEFSFRSISKGQAELGSEEERKKAEEERKEKEKTYSDLLGNLQQKLEEHVKEVRLSNRLTSSPACLVGDTYDLSPQLEQLLRNSGQEVPKSKRILELNPTHPLLEKLQKIHAQDPSDPMLSDYAQLLFGQSILAEGGQLPDPGAFSRLVSQLMAKAI